MIPSYIVKIHREEKTERGNQQSKLILLIAFMMHFHTYPATAAQNFSLLSRLSVYFCKNIYFQHTKPYQN